jgi:uncharacterized protein (TIGR02611 family)
VPEQQADRQEQASRRPSAPDRDRETVLDDLARSLHFRDFIRRHRWLDVTYRALVGLVGVLVVLGGFALIPLPGPGWLIVFTGLAILATEFEWAERLLRYGRSRLRAWSEWIKARSLPVRLLFGAVSLAFVAALVAAYAAWQGVPGWVPVIG